MRNRDFGRAAIVANAIPEGRQNAITRAELAARLDMTDRDIREAIEDARAFGIWIINDGDGRGYYKSTDIADIRRQYWREKARLKSIYASSKPLRDFLKAAGEEV